MTAFWYAGEEEPLLAAEVLEDGALRDRELARDVLDARRVVAALGEVAHRRFEDAGALGLRARPGADEGVGDAVRSSRLFMTSGHPTKGAS